MSGVHELTGGLIQMNARMVATGDAVTVIAIAAVTAALALLAAFIAWLDGKKRWWMYIIAAAICAVAVVIGCRMPRVREIHACAVGPVSLEQVAAVYDIVSVDGKELVLRERIGHDAE